MKLYCAAILVTLASHTGYAVSPLKAEPVYATVGSSLNPAPHYPAASRHLGEEGLVVLRVLVNESGRPETVELRTSSGFARLDESAVIAVRTWQFVPMMKMGEPIATWVTLPIRFELPPNKNLKANPSELQQPAP